MDVEKVIENGVLKKFTDKPKRPELLLLDNTVKKIGEYAFSECKNIIEIVLPVTLDEISDKAFANSCIKEIYITENIKRIGKEAFADCKGLQYIEIPFSVTEIDEGAFSGCVNLKRIVFKNSVVDNSVVFENRITKINDRTFENCEALQKIEMPKNITEIGEHAFCGCRNLKTVVIPDSVISVGKEAFAYCRSLKDIVFSKNISQMGDGALMDCMELENVILSCNISAVPKEMFARCLSLKNVIVTNGETTSVKRVEADAFVYCEKLENVIFSDALEYVGRFAFGLCKNLRHAPTLQVNAQIENCAFMDCYKLDYVAENNNADRKHIYQFMLRAADNFNKDTAIFELVFCWGGYSIKFVADKADYGIYSIYGCDDDGEKQSECPVFTGSADEIVKYLNDKENIDNVLKSMPEM